MVHKDGTPLGDAELVNVFKKRLDRKLRDAWQPSQEAQEEMLRRGVNSLVVASNDPLEDVPKLLPYLALRAFSWCTPSTRRCWRSCSPD